MAPSDEQYEYCQCQHDLQGVDNPEPDESLPCKTCLLDIKPVESSSNLAIPATAEKVSKPDDSIVYQAFKDVKPFQVENSQRFTETRIRKSIRKRQGQANIQRLVKAYGMAVLTASVKGLLRDGVFLSADTAKARFPELFLDAPDNEPAHEATTDLASKGETVEDDAAAGVSDEQPLGEFLGALGERGCDATLAGGVETWVDAGGHPKRHSEPETCQTPVHLSFDVQHRLVSTLQKLLEQACFAYGQESMPEILRERNWDCAEAVELDSWMDEFLCRHKTFPAGQADGGIQELFHAVADIRHAAVRRIRTDSVGIQGFLTNAERLCGLLKTRKYGRAIECLRIRVMEKLVKAGRENGILEDQLEAKLSDIARERERLDALEQAAITEMEGRVRANEREAGAEITRALGQCEANLVVSLIVG